MQLQKFHLHENRPEKVQFEIFPLADYLKGRSHNTQRPHVHSFYQILWFRSGRGRHFVDFNGYDVVENSIFFIAKGQIHHFDEVAYDGYIIHFNESFLSANENDIHVFLKHTIFHSFEKEPVFTLNEPKCNELDTICQQMHAEITQPHEFAHRDYLTHLLHLFLIIIQRYGVRHNCAGLNMNKISHILFVKFRNLIEENYKQLHTVTEYAQLLHVSNKTLTNTTNEIAHATPLEIINDRIILEAHRLLSYSQSSIAEIGYQLGFEDPSYFIKYFKRQTGVLPGEFRKVIS